MRFRRRILTATIFGLAGLAARTNVPEPPSFEEAARRLDADARDLAGVAGLRSPGKTRTDGTSCVAGQLRHSFSAESHQAGARPC